MAREEDNWSVTGFSFVDLRKVDTTALAHLTEAQGRTQARDLVFFSCEESAYEDTM